MPRNPLAGLESAEIEIHHGRVATPFLMQAQRRTRLAGSSLILNPFAPA
jgi:hypothetical protein